MQKEKEIKRFYKTSLTKENFIKVLGYEKALIYSKNNEIFINSLKIKDENINVINEKEFMKYHSDKKNSIVKNVTELFLTEEKKYYRSIKLRNISEKLDIFQLFKDYEVYINFEKKENLIAILNNSYENERKKYEKNLPFEYEKIKSTLDELNGIEFNQKLIFDLKIVLESDSIENLNEKTEELRKKNV